MRDVTAKWLTTFFLILMATGIMAFHAEAVSDPRFFGTYCGNHEEPYTVWCCFGGHWFVTARGTLRFSITSHAYYREIPHGNGLVTGKGRVRGEGEDVPFVFSGVVTERGRLRGTAIEPGRDPAIATAILSGDGNTVTAHALGRTVVLRKDQCGNSAPSVRIISPATGTDFGWGEHFTFLGSATDPEDASFPRERLVWTSSRDGGWHGTGPTPFGGGLTPGTHTITFSATDSGGRTTTASIRIQVINNRPNLPRINEPLAGATFYAGDEIAFRAWATDPEDGYLSDDSLVWSSSRDGRIGTDPIGTAPLKRTLSEGNHTITLTATDRAGLSNSASVRITVRPRPAGNTPPTVTIMAPGNYYAYADFDCITFVAEASDFEDVILSGVSLVWRDQYHDGAVMRRRDLGTGEWIDICNLPTTGHDTRHTISVTATDSGGLSTTNSIVVIVIPGGLI